MVKYDTCNQVLKLEYNKFGEPIRILGVTKDITNRKNDEIKLQKSYEELSSLYEEIAASEEELKEQVNRLNITSYNLSESERRLNKAQEIGHVGNWEYDLRRKTMWASEEGLRLFWTTSKDGFVSGEYVHECFDPIDRAKAL